MPSALESLVKVLKLERENGYNNNAVIGGLKAYGDNWVTKAHNQAKIPDHHILVDELVDLLRHYDDLDTMEDRHDTVSYMLERITGRTPPPDEYLARLDQYEAETEQKQAQPASKRDEERRSNRGKRPRKQEQPASRKKPEQTEAETTVSIPAHKLDIPPEPRLSRPPRPRPNTLGATEAADILRGLRASVEKVKGVGPRMVSALNRLGIQTINDLLFTLPRRYDDYTRMRYISQLQPETVTTVIGSVREVQTRIGRNGRKDLYIELDDGSGVLPVTFFGQQYLIKSIRKGKQIVVSGKVTLFRGKPQMTNPEWEELDRENLHTTGIVPVYRLTEGLSARRLRNLMKDTVSYWADRLPDYVPLSVLERADLADLNWTIRNLHFPEGHDHLAHAQRRYIFDQLLLLQMAILAHRREWQENPGQPLTYDDDALTTFLGAVFPYTLTDAQRRAIDEIRADISQNVPMNRLLQGDVGSGKTAVAVTALAIAYANGTQAALMAPTGILAEQHYRNISRTLADMPGDDGPTVALLTSSLSASERDTVYAGLADGSIDIVIGTHAVIQEGVEFDKLALVVIDEQHRFGTAQRGALRGKGTNPHLLVMTATPIPRTLTLTLHADLDLSVIDEMPPGRTPVNTRVVLPSERERIFSFIKARLEAGEQAFIVHPLVEASDKVEAASAVEAYDELQQVFHRHRVCLLHGQMKPAEKDAIMAAFADHEYDVMVTTSVAEVGVDIPNASVIVIEGANRFGLAQLHQFRGRVGRGGHVSYCLLIPDDVTSDTARQLEGIDSWEDIEDGDLPVSVRRLAAMERTTDGFKLAEVDWRLRGAGDLVGTRQSGQSPLQIAELMTPELVALAQREARTLYAEDAYLEQDEHQLLRERVAMLYNEDSDVS
jgi:ATP-dependent DNA helicase RecG